MKVLAHYTIFGDKIFNLHSFDIKERTITHRKVEEETAHTAFIQGILIIAKPLSIAQTAEINDLLTQNKSKDLRTLSENITTYLKENNKSYTPDEDFSLLISIYPDFILSKL